MQEMKSSWKYYQLSTVEQQSKNWADSVKNIATVKSFPELLYTSDQTKAAGIENFLDLNFFRENIQPLWEDSSNVNGGRIIMEVPLNQKDILHSLWTKTVIFCALEPTEGINGCVFAEKANYRICIWIADPSHADEITNAWRYVLSCSSAMFSFSLHNRPSDGARYKKGFGKGKPRFQ